MAVIGDYSNRLTIVARQHALNRAAPVRLEGNPLANPELEHVRVGADVLQQTETLDDAMVEVDQFGFRQPVNVDHHEAAPSELNGVSTLQRPSGKRKPRRYHRHCRVDDPQCHAALTKLLGERQCVAGRARQAVEPGHDEFIARAQDAPAQQVEFGPLAHARGLLGVDIALGTAGGDQVADLGLQPGFLIAGGGPGVAEGRHALFLPEHLNEVASIMLPILYSCIWQTSYGCAATALWGCPCGMGLAGAAPLPVLSEKE